MDYLNLNQATNQITNNNYSNTNDINVRKDTPNILRELGVKNLPMQMTSKHLVKALAEFRDGAHCHGISAHTMEMIPFAIIDPVFIFDSDKDDGTVVVVTDLYDDMDQPIMVCIKVCGYTTDGGSANFITSIYGKRRDGIVGQFNRALNDGGRLLYCNKAKWVRMQNRIQIYAYRDLDYEYRGQKEYGDKGFLYFSGNAEVAEQRSAKENREN